MSEPTHKFGSSPSGFEFIECLRCGLKSYNENDIAQKYCGKCSGFHPLPEKK